MQRTLQLEPADRVLQKTALSFDASVWECWLPLICGAQLVIAEPGLSADMSRLWARVEALGITIVRRRLRCCRRYCRRRRRRAWPACAI
nr:amino acid adenylation domain-containing protein [Pseudomonas sp. BIGb0427]